MIKMMVESMILLLVDFHFLCQMENREFVNIRCKTLKGCKSDPSINGRILRSSIEQERPPPPLLVHAPMSKD